MQQKNSTCTTPQDQAPPRKNVRKTPQSVRQRPDVQTGTPKARRRLMDDFLLMSPPPQPLDTNNDSNASFEAQFPLLSPLPLPWCPDAPRLNKSAHVYRPRGDNQKARRSLHFK